MLKRRIEKLETQSTDRNNVLVIVGCYFGPSGWIEPAIGYHIGSEQLFRLHGETDEDFEDRACVAIRAQAPRDALVLRLNPISEGSLCEA